MRYTWNRYAIWRFRLALHSFYRRHANFNFEKYQIGARLVTCGRRNPKNHLLFALSYAAVSLTIARDELEETRTVKCYNPLPDEIEELQWEKLVHNDSVCVYRRWISSIGTYEYRCAGSYNDISAENFVKAQMDIDYRKEWDPSVLYLTVLEQRDKNVEVLKWVHKFPRPMSPRIYIYLRQMIFDEETQSMQVDSQALDENEWANEPLDKGYVRVTTYKSRLTLFAHSKFTENGFDYVLTYYDYPKSAIPGPAYNWMVNYGGHYFLKDVHAAAKKLASSNVSD